MVKEFVIHVAFPQHLSPSVMISYFILVISVDLMDKVKGVVVLCT